MCAQFRKYTHIQKLGRDEVGHILSGHVVVQPKLDGSCSLVYSRNGEIYTGSRTRELGEDKDNAGFDKYIHESDESRIIGLRSFVLARPNYIVYGEWLGNCAPYCGKFVGSIKRYLEGGFYIFDVFDIEQYFLFLVHDHQLISDHY